MGTVVQVRVYTEDPSADAERAIERAIEAAFGEIRRLEGLMTTWRPESEVSRINAAAGQGAVPVGPEVRQVIRRALEFSRRSGGAFDISFYALRGLWKFDEDLTPALPDPRLLAERRRLIDWRQIHVDDKQGTVRLGRPGMAINLGGIGKGFAVDAAAAVLRKMGYKDHIVQAGGDLLLSGTKGGQPWMAGVRDPRGPADDYFAVCPVVDHAFSTAGDYERSFILDGKRYHHIIDPRTGYPATRARSVTIYARDATTADGLDDAVLILGAAAGLRLIEAVEGAGAIIVDDKNQVHVSSRLRGKVRIVHPPTPGL
jgi:thiamine biosynthesis lipoprotein